MSDLRKWIACCPHKWAQNVILDLEDIYPSTGNTPMQRLVTEEVVETCGSMDMRCVVGQLEHYAGQTWQNAVLDPKINFFKIKAVLDEYAQNPNYYFSGKPLNDFSFCSVNSQDWYSVSGNHRTILAKFLTQKIFDETGNYPLVRGVTKHRYQVDMEAWHAFEQLKDLTDSSITTIIKPIENSRITDGNITTVTMKLTFQVFDSRFGAMRSEVLNRDHFLSFANHILIHGPTPSKLDRVRHFLSNEIQDKLIMPRKTLSSM